MSGGRARITAFAFALAAALAVFLPMRLALAGFGASGLSARAVNGSVWHGTLADAALGPVSLGTIDARLKALPLLTGHARIALARSDPDPFAATLDLLRTEKSRVAANPKRWAYWQLRTGNQLANDFFEAGDTLNAHAIYSGLLELSPEPNWRLPILYQIGLCYERLGVNERARASYQSIVDTAGANPPADLAELTRMAAWRIEHLAWREKVGEQITTFFSSSSARQAATLPAGAPLKTSNTP